MRPSVRSPILAVVLAAAACGSPAAGAPERLDPPPDTRDGTFHAGLVAGGIPSNTWDSATVTAHAVCAMLDQPGAANAATEYTPGTGLDINLAQLDGNGLDDATALAVLQLGVHVYCPRHDHVLTAWAGDRRS